MGLFGFRGLLGFAGLFLFIGFRGFSGLFGFMGLFGERCHCRRCSSERLRCSSAALRARSAGLSGLKGEIETFPVNDGRIVDLFATAILLFLVDNPDRTNLITRITVTNANVTRIIGSIEDGLLSVGACSNSRAGLPNRRKNTEVNCYPRFWHDFEAVCPNWIRRS